MNKVEKRAMNRRLLGIYIGYLAVLVLAFLQSFLPMMGRSMREAVRFASCNAESWYIVAVQPQLFAAPWRELPVEGSGVQLQTSPYEGFISMTIDSVQQPMLDAQLSLLDSVIGFIDWLSIAAWVVILILTTLIINSLRRSIKEQKPLSVSNVGWMRWIGGLVIIDELMRGVSTYISHRMVQLAAPELEGYAGGFNPEYGTIILGLLLLFAAEIFALGRRLSEEQRYTI